MAIRVGGPETFRDVVAVDNYGGAPPESIDFAKRLFGFFGKLDIYGDSGTDRAWPPGTHLRDQKHNWLHLGCGLETVEREKDAAGWAVFMDDVLVMPWNLAGYDLDRLWYVAISPHGHELGHAPYINFRWAVEADGKGAELGCAWHWTRTDHGLCQYQKAWKAFPDWAKERLRRVTGLKQPAIGCVSEFFYLPARLREPFLAVARPLVDHEVWLEIAVPTALAAIEDPDQHEHIAGHWIWGSQFPDWSPWFRETWQVMHPVKFSADSNRWFARCLYEHHGWWA